MEKVKIFAVCGSPVKDSNTEVYLRECLKVADEFEKVEYEMVSLRGKKISDCRHCNWCMFHYEPAKYCAINDDMTPLYPKFMEADAFIAATPVYLTRMSGYLACFMDRLRAFSFGTYRGLEKNKVFAPLAVIWYRHGGVETAMLGLCASALCLEWIPVSVHHSGAIFGGGAVTSIGGTGEFDPEDKHQVLKDEWGLVSGRAIVRRVIEVTRMLKAGETALRLEGVDHHVHSISAKAKEYLDNKWAREHPELSPAKFL